MTDIATGFVQAIEAFLTTQLGKQASTTWHDTGPFLGAVVTFDAPERKTTFDKLKADVEAMKPEVKAIADKIKEQTTLIGKLVGDATADVKADDFNFDVAARVAVRLGMVLSAADEAYNIIATELAKDTNGVVDEAVRTKLMGLWSPWAQPFKDMGAGGANLLNKFGKLFGIDDLVGELGKVLTLEHPDAGKPGAWLLTATFTKSGTVTLGALTLDQLSFQAFLQFSDREIANPTDEEKKTLVHRGDKWYLGDVAILGLRIRTIMQPGLTSTPMLKQIMPGSPDPKSQTITAVSLDTGQGFYIGDGRANERAVLPVRFSFPGVELREMAFGLVRNPAREVTAFELTTSIAANIGDVVGLQVVGAGFVVTPDGVVEQQAMFNLPVSLRWPDAVGLRIKAGPVTGGGFIQRVERTYQVNGQPVKRIEFGGVIQLKIIKLGLDAIVIFSPDPFSLVLVIGIHFPVAIDVGFGFTLNGIGGILAINRTVDIAALQAGLKEHIIDRMLFPDDPIKEAPTLLDKVAHVFPIRDGGFVIGPIAELGWGSQAKFVTLKLGIVLALPDPSVVILGSLRIRVAEEKAPITDIKADLFIAITSDYLLMFASMRDSQIAGFSISGDLGLYIQWGGGGAFELSVGGFHPEYEKLTGGKPRLGAMERVTIDLSPGQHDKNGKGTGPVTFVVKAYFAVTAGAVMLGVEGRFAADFGIAGAKAWVVLDMIFIWSPRFAFKVSIEVGAEVDLFGHTFASITLRGALSGTQPWSLSGHIKVDVWFLPTFDKDLGPITWGDDPPALDSKKDALQIALTALEPPDAWRVTLPEHAAQLVTLAAVDVGKDRIAHPLAGIEMVQSQVPLNVKISHIGSSPVAADMVMLGTPSSTAVVAAISELRTAFAPGQYFDLDGEQLLARSGFEDLVGGCRIAAATTPKVGADQRGEVRYHTYIRRHDDPKALDLQDEMRFAAVATHHAAATNVGRATMRTTNPYDTGVRPPEPRATIAEKGTSQVSDALTGTTLLGAMSQSEAAAVVGAVNAAGLSATTRTTLKG
ncbi:hypothetical protein GA0111570_103339 [Raineyella antarctica]|uniref:DUF6603 domain-containing protein n=1 Tax=Raineyella antarctica TaxID=1577474 RepID=A0A1G6GIK1_9ACTN|nr:DUF6603 domain-containing protein [Raineyella antarctica]SDB81764.1 hypothetical protein GA0111570_103339 [Raineyella antarctica]